MKNSMEIGQWFQTDFGLCFPLVFIYFSLNLREALPAMFNFLYWNIYCNSHEHSLKDMKIFASSLLLFNSMSPSYFLARYCDVAHWITLKMVVSRWNQGSSGIESLKDRTGFVLLYITSAELSTMGF